jgi:hypothetical protein
MEMKFIGPHSYPECLEEVHLVNCECFSFFEIGETSLDGNEVHRSTLKRKKDKRREKVPVMMRRTFIMKRNGVESRKLI